MNNLEFWLLMGVYALHTVLVLGAAYLIMRAQNAFNARLHREVAAAIVNIREDMKKPELFKAVGQGIAEQVATTVRNSLSGMYGNVVKTVNGPARDPISKFFYVLTARNKAGAIKKVMMDGANIPNHVSMEPGPQGVGAETEGQTGNSGSVGSADSQRFAEMNAYVKTCIEQDPALQAKIDAKAKELGLA